MDTKIFSVLFVVLVTFCLTVGTALADETTVFEPLGHKRSAATTLYVAATGDCGGKIPCYSSIQTAMTDAENGATIEVAQGTYTEDITSSSKTLGLQGGWNSTFTTNDQSIPSIVLGKVSMAGGNYNIKGLRFKKAPSGYTNSLGMTFVLLPAETFTMGSPSDEPGRDDSDEGPQHTVTLTHAFYMQQTEVTQAQWEAVMGSNPSHFSGCPTCPVEMVSWNDVQEFITKMNERGEGTYGLPTEARWEYAARARVYTAFYNGGITELYCGYEPNLDAIGWYCYNSEFKTHPVARKALPNGFGLCDMSGNVGEWCSDRYDGNYYSISPTNDPQGPSSGSGRVYRGCGWSNIAQSCRSASRNFMTQDARLYNMGFRLVLSSGQQ